MAAMGSRGVHAWAIGTVRESRQTTHHWRMNGMEMAMEFEEFVKALHQHGWGQVSDAQHTEIRKLWEKMFPVIAKLSDEVFALECELEDLRQPTAHP